MREPVSWVILESDILGKGRWRRIDQASGKRTDVFSEEELGRWVQSETRDHVLKEFKRERRIQCSEYLPGSLQGSHLWVLSWADWLRLSHAYRICRNGWYVLCWRTGASSSGEICTNRVKSDEQGMEIDGTHFHTSPEMEIKPIVTMDNRKWTRRQNWTPQYQEGSELGPKTWALVEIIKLGPYSVHRIADLSQMIWTLLLESPDITWMMRWQHSYVLLTFVYSGSVVNIWSRQVKKEYCNIKGVLALFSKRIRIFNVCPRVLLLLSITSPAIVTMKRGNVGLFRWHTHVSSLKVLYQLCQNVKTARPFTGEHGWKDGATQRSLSSVVIVCCEHAASE